MGVSIHPTAIVDTSAQLSEGVNIGPYSIIEADTVIGEDCMIASHVVIKRYTRLGQGNRIHEHAVIGGDPQDISFDRNSKTYVKIGDDNVIREGVTIHRATKEGNATFIGNGNFIMAQAHIAHDCRVGNKAIFANGATLGGHVSVDDRAFLSGFVAVHQFCRIGRLIMISGLAGVVKDCLPFLLIAGNPAHAFGLNMVGLKRAGFTAEEIRTIKQAYQLLFLSGHRFRDACAEVARWNTPLVQEWLAFIEAASKRGITRHHRD